MSAILEHLDEVLYVLRFPQGDLHRAAVQFVTGRARAITGCEPKEFTEDPGLWLSLLHPDDLPAVQKRPAGSLRASARGSGSTASATG